MLPDLRRFVWRELLSGLHLSDFNMRVGEIFSLYEENIGILTPIIADANAFTQERHTLSGVLDSRLHAERSEAVDLAP